MPTGQRPPMLQTVTVNAGTIGLSTDIWSGFVQTALQASRGNSPRHPRPNVTVNDTADRSSLGHPFHVVIRAAMEIRLSCNNLTTYHISQMLANAASNRRIQKLMRFMQERQKFYYEGQTHPGRYFVTAIFGGGYWPQPLSTQCSMCNRYKAKHNFTLRGGEISPESDEIYVSNYCNICSERLGWCNNCNINLRIDGSENCLACEQQRTRAIQPYSANPIIILRKNKLDLNKKKVYQGVELEVEVIGSTEHIANIVKPLLLNKAIIKHDGSLSNGFEICSLPMEEAEHIDYWGKLFESEVFKNEIHTDDQPTAGLHIHASRAPLSTMQIAKYVSFMNARQNRKLMLKMAGRQPNHYCQYSERKVIDIIRHKHRQTKYEVVNTLHPASIEVRAFQSTQIHENMVARLQFVRSGLQYCGMAKSKELTAAKYADWLKQAPQRKEFKTLLQHMKNWPSGIFNPVIFQSDMLRDLVPSNVWTQIERTASCGCDQCFTQCRNWLHNSDIDVVDSPMIVRHIWGTQEINLIEENDDYSDVDDDGEDSREIQF